MLMGGVTARNSQFRADVSGIAVVLAWPCGATLRRGYRASQAMPRDCG